MPTIIPASTLGRIGTTEALATATAALKTDPESVRTSAAHAAMAAADQMIQNGKRIPARPLLDSIQSAVIPDYLKKAAASLTEK